MFLNNSKSNSKSDLIIAVGTNVMKEPLKMTAPIPTTKSGQRNTEPPKEMKTTLTQAPKKTIITKQAQVAKLKSSVQNSKSF